VFVIGKILIILLLNLEFGERDHEATYLPFPVIPNPLSGLDAVFILKMIFRVVAGLDFFTAPIRESLQYVKDLRPLVEAQLHLKPMGSPLYMIQASDGVTV